VKVGDLVKSAFTFFEGQLGLIVATDVWDDAVRGEWHIVKLFCSGEERTLCEFDMKVAKECQENVKSDEPALTTPSERDTL
jgi:hypothetical protein